LPAQFVPAHKRRTNVSPFNTVYRVRRIAGCTVLQVLTSCGVCGYLAVNCKIESIRALQLAMAVWTRQGTLEDHVRIKGVQL
jgi:hypothetical protein